jgi:hypothetical protein
MQFVKDNEWYKVVRVTGPSHNLLGIAFAKNGAQSDVVIEALPVETNAPSKLHGKDVRQNVEAGVAEANEALNVNYSVSRIQFVPTDTPPASVYRMLARSIVERLVATQGRF